MVPNMTLVDVYYISNNKLKEYIKKREYFAQIAIELYSNDSYIVRREHADSLDGEAIVGYDKKGNVIHFILLDPYSLEKMELAERKEHLEKYLNNN
ncbi:MAG: hypothetical protein GYA87_04470 [Christensenellaceae bacterium]|nr:hypothetical protein [Christensenellaceae bacterium]